MPSAPDVHQAPDQLVETPIDRAPKDTLYRLEEPIFIDGEIVGEPGQYLIVHDPARLHFEERTIFEAARKYPQLAFAMIYTRNLIRVVLIAPRLHEGPGERVETGKTPGTRGSKRSILPSSVTARIAPRGTGRPHDLPRDRDLVLATDHLRSERIGTHLEALADNPAVTRNSPLAEFVLDSVYIRKGQLVTLAGPDSLILQTNRRRGDESFTLDPRSELNVFFMQDVEKPRGVLSAPQTLN